MSRRRIRQGDSARCLLTEVTPYETPTLFSNWGSYNFVKNLRSNSPDPFLDLLFRYGKRSVPMRFMARKDSLSQRTLFLAHPHHSTSVTKFYSTFDVAILANCRRSQYSLRAPSVVAKFYSPKKPLYVDDKESWRIAVADEIENVTESTRFAYSYFAYRPHSHLWPFFKSSEFVELEKQFQFMESFDINRCFPSIYTHSISWALRTKSKAKILPQNSESFDSSFDRLIRKMNDNETNGIIIGPELSRIFAEIVLQRIDSLVHRSLKAQDIVLGKDYMCRRFIDDYFFFYNTAACGEAIKRTLQEFLSEFNLDLNKKKHTRILRPFISEISLRKISIEKLASAMQKAGADRGKAISDIRTILKTSDVVDASHLGNLGVSLFAGNIKRLLSGEGDIFCDLVSNLEILFYIFRLDTRASNCFKISEVALLLRKTTSRLDPDQGCVLRSMVISELVGALFESVRCGSNIEAICLLVILKEFKGAFSLPKEALADLVKDMKHNYLGNFGREKRLSYFEIIGVLYFIGNDPEYAELRNHLVDATTALIESNDPFVYSETAHLLLDMISCPYLEEREKLTLLEKAATHLDTSWGQQALVRAARYLSRHSWFFAWRGRYLLHLHFQKKQLVLSY